MVTKFLNKFKDGWSINQCVCVILLWFVIGVSCVRFFSDYAAIEKQSLSDHPKIYKATIFERMIGAPKYYKNEIYAHLKYYSNPYEVSDKNHVSFYESGVSDEKFEFICKIIDLNLNLCNNPDSHNRYLALRIKQYCIWVLTGKTFKIIPVEPFYYQDDAHCALDVWSSGIVENCGGVMEFMHAANTYDFCSLDEYIKFEWLNNL